MASKPRSTTPSTTRPAAPRTKSPAAASANRVTSPEPDRSATNDDQIRDRAYFLWEEAGRPVCDGVQFWLEAENELRAKR